MSSLEQLLAPYLRQPLSSSQIGQFEAYLDLLLRWNAKISLTAVRDREDIVRRHFGESLFAGEQLHLEDASSLIDFGSGAGFPGLPIKILCPHLEVTLIESQHKKATFIGEVIRTLKLEQSSVYAGRAEQFKYKSQIVTMRAVENFEAALPVAVSLVEPDGRLALLIGARQVEVVRGTLPNFRWLDPSAIPESRERVVLMGLASKSS